MDHRCLYGHRVSESFAFAIEQRQCPVCGAPTVSVLGYQLARRLAAEVKLEALQAFNAIRLIEDDYVLAPKPEDDAQPSQAVTDESQELTEIEVPEDEFEISQDAPGDTPAAPAAVGHDDTSTSKPTEVAATAADHANADPVEAPERRRVEDEATAEEDENGFSAVENDFFLDA